MALQWKDLKDGYLQIRRMEQKQWELLPDGTWKAKFFQSELIANSNEELLKNYMNVFHAEYLGMLHQYQFYIYE